MGGKDQIWEKTWFDIEMCFGGGGDADLRSNFSFGWQALQLFFTSSKPSSNDFN